MNINIKTHAEGCHISVNIKVQGQTLLRLTDNDEGSINLFSGISYRFEWFVITAKEAHILNRNTMNRNSNNFKKIQ